MIRDRTSVTTLLPPPPEHFPLEPAAEVVADPTTSLLASVVERLYRDYDGYLPLARVVDVVAGCLQDIQATPTAALPELTERLARHRLAQLSLPGRS
jgi:hypothetical protein